MPAFYKRYVDYALSTMPNKETASEFLMTLNGSHPSINFTMELKENGRLPFLGHWTLDYWHTIIAMSIEDINGHR